MTYITHDTFGEVTGYTATAGATGLFTTSYTRDKLGRVTTLTETIGGTTDTYAYTYDTAGRLTDVTVTLPYNSTSDDLSSPVY